MTRQPWPTLIRNARDSTEQIAILRALKNEIVGHAIKKEMVVALGLEPIARLSLNKSHNRQDGKAHDYSFALRPLAEEEIVRLQGLQVIASIAHGGPAFLGSLQSASAVQAILSNISPSNNPPQLVLAALRAFSNIADSSALGTGVHPLNINHLADALFIRQHLSSLARIVSQTSPSSTVQSQISLTASIISRICREERHQQSLATSGVLDSLATKLASFVVAEGLVLPGAELSAQRDGIQEYIPPPAPPNANLFVILEAVAIIIADSKFRASQLLYHPSILAIFPVNDLGEALGPKTSRAAWTAFNTAGSGARQSQLNAIDYLLPSIPVHHVKTSQSEKNYPPLGATAREQFLINGRSKYNGSPLPTWTDSSDSYGVSASPDNREREPEEPESPLIAFLLLILRARDAMERLMAAFVLTVLYRMGLTNKTRETALGLLVVPLLVQMLSYEVIPETKGLDDLTTFEATAIDWAIKERAPAILAMLITDSEYLHKATFDCKVIDRLSKMIKMAYEPVPKNSIAQHWSPHTDESIEDFDQSKSSRLGDRGQSAFLAHKIKVRESVLKAVAALVPFKEEYRKAVVDHGMMPYIVESLSANPKKPSQKVNEKSEGPDTKGGDSTGSEAKTEGYGTNPVEVLIAACGAVRALSRSVSILRTTLIDNGIATPVFRLLQHPDIEVQIAATAAVCNLVTDVSPMRETFTEAGVLKILCEHAHSMNAKLRLNAIWALKHFVYSVSNEMKRSCLEELGPGWLVQLICDDTEDEALLSSRARGDLGAFSGVNDEMDEDVEMDQFEDQNGSNAGASYSRSNNSRPSSSRSKSIQQVETKLAALKDAETNPARKARKDDVAVQEQSLDFIRNMIYGAGQGNTVETTEMIDYLFNSLGQDRLFEILASKLRPKVLNPFNRRSSNVTETRVLPPQPEIINSVSYILVHMAASVPRHRQLVIAQTELLKLLVPQFNHPYVQVREAMCWLVTNLTWVDDSNDGPAATHRANELKKLGFLTKLEMLEHDPELNVRERAKSAIWQMKQGF